MEEKSNIDEFFRNGTAGFSTVPSDAVWQGIAGALDVPPPARKRRAIVWWMWGGLAAALLICAFWLYNISQNVSTLNEEVAAQTELLHTLQEQNQEQPAALATDENQDDANPSAQGDEAGFVAEAGMGSTPHDISTSGQASDGVASAPSHQAVPVASGTQPHGDGSQAGAGLTGNPDPRSEMQVGSNDLSPTASPPGATQNDGASLTATSAQAVVIVDAQNSNQNLSKTPILPTKMLDLLNAVQYADTVSRLPLPIAQASRWRYSYYAALGRADRNIRGNFGSANQAARLEDAEKAGYNYEFGAGLQYAVAPRWWLGVGAAFNHHCYQSVIPLDLNGNTVNNDISGTGTPSTEYVFDSDLQLTVGTTNVSFTTTDTALGNSLSSGGSKPHQTPIELKTCTRSIVIPVTTEYEWGKGRLRGLAYGGISLHMVTTTEITWENESAFEDPRLSALQSGSLNYFRYRIGAGAAYYLSPRSAVRVQPVFSSAFTAATKVNELRAYPWAMQVQVGLSHKIGR